MNGKLVESPGVMIVPNKDFVRVDDKLVTRRAEQFVYFAMHKPKGVITTLDDPAKRPTVMALLPAGVRTKVFPVGRLDLNSEGLLLFTNDGVLAHRLMHPGFKLPKVYIAKFRGVMTPDEFSKLTTGVRVDGRTLRADSAERLVSRSKHTWVRLVLTTGLYRQIRLMGRATDHPVIKLKRIAIGPVMLGDLPIGKTRPLTEEEVELLRKLAARSAKPDGSRPAPQPGKGALRGLRPARRTTLAKEIGLRHKPNPNKRKRGRGRRGAR